MSDRQEPMGLSPRDAELIALYAEDLLTEEQAKELNARLHAEPKLLTAIVQLTEVEELLRVLLEEAHASDPGDWYEVMSELARVDEQPQPIHIDSSSPLTRQAYTSALSYVIEHTFTPKRVAMMITAAVLLLGVVLVITFLTGPDNEQPIAEVPEQPVATDVQIDVQPIVATLTNELNAQWRGSTGTDLPGVGEGLHAGQRLILVDGLAEITTKRGAVAVLEAPATVELLDQDNAIRLHEGKLVGVCETESSKELIVYTPHTVITDLGTRFGVDVSKSGRTQVHVIEGSVEVASPTPGSEQLKLEVGESVAADGRGKPQPIDFAPSQFVTDHEFAVRKDAPQSAWARSMAARYERARAGGVLLGLSFEEDGAGGVRATSIAEHDSPLLVKAEGLVPGRFGKRTAVRLSDNEHFVQATLDQPMQAATVAGWYYIDGLDHQFTSLFHSTYTGGQEDLGNLHWHIKWDNDQSVELGVYQHDEIKSEEDRAFGDTHFTSASIPEDSLTGRWVHLAMTLDASSGEFVIYLNSQPIGSRKRDGLLPIVLGEIQIGNWDCELAPAPSRPQEDTARSLRGAVDGFIVFDRSLTSEEISDLYRSETP